MTNEEYSDLKYKIVARENRYIIIAIIVVILIYFGLVTIIIQTSGQEIKGTFPFEQLAIILLTTSSLIIGIANPWNNKRKELDELFKSKVSYQEAEMKLGLKYEPPKD